MIYRLLGLPGLIGCVRYAHTNIQKVHKEYVKKCEKVQKLNVYVNDVSDSSAQAPKSSAPRSAKSEHSIGRPFISLTN